MFGRTAQCWTVNVSVSPGEKIVGLTLALGPWPGGFGCVGDGVVGGVLGGSFVDGADGVGSLPPAGGAGSAANAGPAALSATIAAAPPAAPRRAMFILPPAVSAWPHRIGRSVATTFSMNTLAAGMAKTAIKVAIWQAMAISAIAWQPIGRIARPR
jgi:hypothetical protein